MKSYSTHHTYKICESIYDADFDEFCKMNNITEPNGEIYKEYLGATFNNASLGYGVERSYIAYQERLYETLLHSWDCHELIYKLKKFININNVTYVNNKRNTTQFSIFTTYEEYDSIDEQRFFSLIHLYNYYVKNVIEHDDNVEIVFEPYKPKDVTDYVYNECKGIIYHVTSERASDKIKNTEIKSKAKHDDNVIYRDGRSFFIASKDKSEVRHELRQLTNLLKLKDPVYIEVDLNEYYNKLRFRLDSSGAGYKVFTEEPVPCFCLHRISLDDLK